MSEMFSNLVNDLTSFRVVWLILGAVAGYLIGSLNLAIVMSRGMGKDIREMGSGNAGTTNTLRTMGKGAALMVLVFDILKGALIPLLVLLTAEKPYNPIPSGFCITVACVYALMAVIGHCYPLYYKFRGGKGIATAAGALLVIAPKAALVAIVVFGLMLLLFRYVSLASIVAVLNIPIYTYLIYDGQARILVTVTLIALLAIFKHRANVKRLREGTESVLFGKKKQDKE